MDQLSPASPPRFNKITIFTLLSSNSELARSLLKETSAVTIDGEKFDEKLDALKK